MTGLCSACRSTRCPGYRAAGSESAHRVAKLEIPELQLALVGTFGAADDPEAPRIYRDVRRHAATIPTRWVALLSRSNKETTGSSSRPPRLAPSSLCAKLGWPIGSATPSGRVSASAS